LLAPCTCAPCLQTRVLPCAALLTPVALRHALPRAAGVQMITFVNTTPIDENRAINRFCLIRNFAGWEGFDGWARSAMFKILGEDKVGLATTCACAPAWVLGLKRAPNAPACWMLAPTTCVTRLGSGLHASTTAQTAPHVVGIVSAQVMIEKLHPERLAQEFSLGPDAPQIAFRCAACRAQNQLGSAQGHEHSMLQHCSPRRSSSPHVAAVSCCAVAGGRHFKAAGDASMAGMRVQHPCSRRRPPPPSSVL